MIQGVMEGTVQQRESSAITYSQLARVARLITLNYIDELSWRYDYVRR